MKAGVCAPSVTRQAPAAPLAARISARLFSSSPLSALRAARGSTPASLPPTTPEQRRQKYDHVGLSGDFARHLPEAFMPELKCLHPKVSQNHSPGWFARMFLPPLSLSSAHEACSGYTRRALFRRDQTLHRRRPGPAVGAGNASVGQISPFPAGSLRTLQ